MSKINKILVPVDGSDNACKLQHFQAIIKNK